MSDIAFDHVSKNFPGVRALVDVSFGVRGGSVHALLGENGAGKSTLLKVLSGAHRPDGGALRIDRKAGVSGAPVVFGSPAEAIAAGVAVIYQELHLVPELSVAENLLLGRLPAWRGVVSRRRTLDEARRLISPLDETIDPRAKVARLSIGQRQMVEIAKALGRGARIIAFDEPTSSLSARETTRLFDVIRELKSRRRAVIYVSHRLDEVSQVCDAATVLRDGRCVRTFESLAGVSQDEIVRSMVGRELRDIYRYRPRAAGEPALSLDGLIAPGLSRPASLTVHRGEIVGLFGLVGAGRSELLHAIYGATRPVGGAVNVWSAPRAMRSPRDAIRAGVLLCPEDRKKDGIIPVRSVGENINLSARRNHARFGLIRGSWERSNAAEQIRRLAIKTPSAAQLVRNLSGGNQQKVILGRWLSEEVRVLLLDEPTRGIDVGAKSEIYAIMYDLAERGIGILMVSSELPEILGVSDRILVMREGRLSGELSRADATEEAVLKLALPGAA